MSLYQLPKFEFLKLKAPQENPLREKKSNFVWFLILVVFVSSVFGFCGGVVSMEWFYLKGGSLLGFASPQIVKKIIDKESNCAVQTTQEEKVIQVVKKVSPAVVSIVITKDVPIIEEYYINPFKEFEEFFGYPFEFKIPEYRQKGTKKKQIGGGTGFIISSDGMILTNAHVVSDESADYTVLTNDGKKYPAKVLGKDSLRDLAVIKIETDKNNVFEKKNFSTITLGDSDNLQIGQTVIAIGNALGEFKNTVSVGVISGLGRTVTASGGGTIETLEDVIQTDAAINRGNSGGPLLNLKGEVIGINFAMAQAAQNIGFAIPINKAKQDIEQVKKLGKIVHPFLGVRYVLVTKEVQQEKNLSVDYGALIVKGKEGEPAISPGSAAEKAGLKEGDIILEVDGEKVTLKNSLSKIIMKHYPGDTITLKVLRKDKEIILKATLGEIQ